MANGTVEVKEKCMGAGRVALPQSGKSCLLTGMAISDLDCQYNRIGARLRELARSGVETGSPDGNCLASTAERWASADEKGKGPGRSDENETILDSVQVLRHRAF